jgi:hypothetical protein
VKASLRSAEQPPAKPVSCRGRNQSRLARDLPAERPGTSSLKQPNGAFREAICSGVRASVAAVENFLTIFGLAGLLEKHTIDEGGILSFTKRRVKEALREELPAFRRRRILRIPGEIPIQEVVCSRFSYGLSRRTAHPTCVGSEASALIGSQQFARGMLNSTGPGDGSGRFAFHE